MHRLGIARGHIEVPRWSPWAQALADEYASAATVLGPIYCGFVEGLDTCDLTGAGALLEALGSGSGRPHHEKQNT